MYICLNPQFGKGGGQTVGDSAKPLCTIFDWSGFIATFRGRMGRRTILPSLSSEAQSWGTVMGLCVSPQMTYAYFICNCYQVIVIFVSPFRSVQYYVFSAFARHVDGRLVHYYCYKQKVTKWLWIFIMCDVDWIIVFNQIRFWRNFKQRSLEATNKFQRFIGIFSLFVAVPLYKMAVAPMADQFCSL